MRWQNVAREAAAKKVLRWVLGAEVNTTLTTQDSTLLTMQGGEQWHGW